MLNKELKQFKNRNFNLYSIHQKKSGGVVVRLYGNSFPLEKLFDFINDFDEYLNSDNVLKKIY